MDLRSKFSFCFADFWQYGTLFKLIGTVCKTVVEQVTEKYQLEIIDLHYDEYFSSIPLLTCTRNIYCQYIMRK